MTAILKARIDWPEVHRRLRSSETLLQQALTPVPARINETFRRRAVRLAGRPIESGVASSTLRVMVVRLGEERYALEIKDLAEVALLTDYTPVPGSPTQFLGVMNLRGDLRPVASLRRMIGVEEPAEGIEESSSGAVLFLRSAAGQIGLKVDGVEELLEIRQSELTRPANGKYVRGLAGKLLLLDAAAVLKDLHASEESGE